ncbi:MAG: ester cyclase [Deltaproteobacteria bacterium]|nr:ester cyclase [Deltaproteobacteria bacterium]
MDRADENKTLITVFPVWHYSIEEIVAEGDREMCRATFRGTHPGGPTMPGVFRGIFSGVAPTGRRVEVDHLHLFRIVNGEIVEYAAVRDDLAMLKQLDLVDVGMV